MKYDNDKQDSDNNKYGRQQNLPGDDAHDTSQKHPHATGDGGQVQPENEQERAQNREDSQKKSEESNLKGKDGGSTHPDHKKDTQTNQSEDPTRKNEANQGASDLRTRERTSFRREGESE
jgi:hypothetical protein